MKLSTVVSYKNLLDTLSSQPAAQELLNEILSMTHVVETSAVEINDAVDQLTQARETVVQATEQFEQQFEQLKLSVQQLIEQHEPAYFFNSLELYNISHNNETPEYIRNRLITVDPVTSVIIQQRLKLYTSWQHPGMVIRPAHARYVEDLVACDPMYFVDTSDQLLEITESWFTPEYQRRLRRYVVDEGSEQPVFINLPSNQFGLIYAFHFFEYRPWPILQQYLRECFGLLRPGGILAFTYNNCDIAGRVGKTEHYSGCYTPGRLVRTYVLELGYEIVFDYDDDSNTSWMELRHPGDYISIRGGQTLAAICQRPDNSMPNEIPPLEEIPPANQSDITNTVDTPSETVYNNLNILLNIAQQVGVDLTQCFNKGQYSVKKLRRHIEQRIHPQMLTEQMITELLNQRNHS